MHANNKLPSEGVWEAIIMESCGSIGWKGCCICNAPAKFNDGSWGSVWLKASKEMKNVSI